jgi:starch phosphorylase
MSAQTDFTNFRHPLQTAEAYSTRTAYFCMEFGIDQALKIFSGGLGYLAGSHMRSAYALKQNLIGIGILWKNGYYDQVRDENSNMDVLFRQRLYNFLEDTNIVFPIRINGHPVYVKAFYLAPEVFGTAPMFFLSTDIPQNDYLARSISHRLYDNNSETKIAQYILLGLGGAKLLEEMNYIPDIYHLNEAHASPAIFHLYNKYQSVDEIRSRFVFTTHTPVSAGNEKHDIFLLERLGFFDGLPLSTVREITHVDGQIYNQSLVCLRMSKLANGVSKMHGEVARNMWKGYKHTCKITHITNSQNHAYWHDPQLDAALEKKDVEALKTRKRELKKELFKIVVDQTGNLFDPDVITLVWARRFARYKRADLITRDIERFERILHNSDRPIQIIWAGKPYPMDYDAIHMFNHLIHLSRGKLNCAVVTGYELGLSKALKQGSDLWLNNPRLTREASGTSGMTAAMNASVNFSVQDGWIPEFAKHGHNSFVIPVIDPAKPHAQQDAHDRDHLLDVLEHEILPMYYDQPDQWWNIVQNSMREIRPFFDSDRMADEYYKVLYNAKVPASLVVTE